MRRLSFCFAFPFVLICTFANVANCQQLVVSSASLPVPLLDSVTAPGASASAVNRIVVGIERPSSFPRLSSSRPGSTALFLPDSVTTRDRAGKRVVHILIGGAAGALIGAGVHYWGTGYSSAVGAILGGIVGAFWPVH